MKQCSQCAGIKPVTAGQMTPSSADCTQSTGGAEGGPGCESRAYPAPLHVSPSSKRVCWVNAPDFALEQSTKLKTFNSYKGLNAEEEFSCKDQ